MRFIQHTILKRLIILLFCVELLAPSFCLLFQIDDITATTKSDLVSVSSDSDIGWPAEEQVEEERNTRIHHVFDLANFCPRLFQTNHTKKILVGFEHRFNRYQTPLYKRHCVFNI